MGIKPSAEISGEDSGAIFGNDQVGAVYADIRLVAINIADILLISANMPEFLEAAGNITTIVNAKDAAATSATEAAASATAALNSQTAAAASAAAAETARTSIDTSAAAASADADAAALSEANALTYRDQAQAHATTAEGHATTATTKAGEATIKATEAATSASQALTSANNADADRIAAETAKTDAVAARDAAAGSATAADASADAAAASAATAQTAANAAGLAGGTTGQALIKSSDADYDYSWVELAGGVTDGNKGDVTVAGDSWTVPALADKAPKIAPSFTGPAIFDAPANNNCVVYIRPAGTGAYSNIQLQGLGNSMSLGMDIIAGGGGGYFSADSLIFRNAAQTVTYLTAAAAAVTINSPLKVKSGLTIAYGADETLFSVSQDAAANYFNSQKVQAGVGYVDASTIFTGSDYSFKVNGTARFQITATGATVASALTINGGNFTFMGQDSGTTGVPAQVEFQNIGKAPGNGSSWAFVRKYSTQQMLLGLSTGTSGNTDGFFGTIPNITGRIYFLTGNGGGSSFAIDATHGIVVGSALFGATAYTGKWDAAGAITVSSAKVNGSSSSDADMILEAPDGRYRNVYFKADGLTQYAFGTNSSGGFSISRYDYSGTWQEETISIGRTTATVTIRADVDVLATKSLKWGGIAVALVTDLTAKADARPGITALSASRSASDSDNNTHLVATGTGQTLTLPNVSAGTSFTGRFSTAWAFSCSGGLSKNGASPTGVTTGNVAAGKLLSFLHEGAGVWLVSGDIT